MSPKGPIVQGSKSLVARDTKSPRKDDQERSLSKVLVPRGAKSVEPHPSTSRALVLRRAAYGSGEIAVTRKISGQEKLSLLAGEMKANAVRAPFRMEELTKMVVSQLGVHLDEISNLKDPEFFYEDIMATIDSRIESAPDKDGKRRPPIHDPKWVALVVGCRIHNVYLLAGSWRIIRVILNELEVSGLDDGIVREQLRGNERMRAKYLVLFDHVTMLARMGQQRVANVAAASAHYAPYFVRKDKYGSSEPEMQFDHRGNNPRKIREAHKSYIDAILLELVLPDSRYPPYVLIACLHDAVEECRKEEKRFTQALWDAVGDLSITLQVLDLLEAPLLGPEYETWSKEQHLNKDYAQFLTAHASSAQACMMVDTWKSSLKPLIDTKKPQVLAQLWNSINKSFQLVSGVGIDTLWSLQTDLQRVPQWSTYHIPGLDVESDLEPDGRALTLHKNAKRNKDDGSGKKRAQITQGEAGDASDDSEMPGLMSVSDSSDNGGSSSDFESEDQRSEGDSESDYDPDEDELLQDMLQEALNAAIDMEDFPEPNIGLNTDGDKKSNNPFTRMLAHLKDRYFSANPTLRADEQSRRPFIPRPGTTRTPSMPRPPAVKSAAKPATKVKRDSNSDVPSLEPIVLPRAKPKLAPTNTAAMELETEEELPPLVAPGMAAPQRNQKTTIEEVEDEDDEDRTKKKKKKKKKKSKKASEVSAPLASPPTPTPAPGPVSSPSKSNKASSVKQSPRHPSLYGSRDGLDVNFSRTSLPLGGETTAQSARSYLQSENLTTEKTKVKSRPAFAKSFFKSDKEKQPVESGKKKGLLERMKKPVFNLPKRTGDLMSRLISPAEGKTHAKKPMKWEEFLKVMRVMGFSYDPSTAGSSVRFDPPDPTDPPITFHKPHPDPTLQRNHLRDFGKRLKKAYGWSPEQFNNFGVGKDDDDD